MDVIVKYRTKYCFFFSLFLLFFFFCYFLLVRKWWCCSWFLRDWNVSVKGKGLNIGKNRWCKSRKHLLACSGLLGYLSCYYKVQTKACHWIQMCQWSVFCPGCMVGKLSQTSKSCVWNSAQTALVLHCPWFQAFCFVFPQKSWFFFFKKTDFVFIKEFSIPKKCILTFTSPVL